MDCFLLSIFAGDKKKFSCFPLVVTLGLWLPHFLVKMNFSGSSLDDPKRDATPDKGAMMEQIKAQLAVAQAQELIQVHILHGR